MVLRGFGELERRNLGSTAEVVTTGASSHNAFAAARASVGAANKAPDEMAVRIVAPKDNALDAAAVGCVPDADMFPAGSLQSHDTRCQKKEAAEGQSKC